MSITTIELSHQKTTSREFSQALSSVARGPVLNLANDQSTQLVVHMSQAAWTFFSPHFTLQQYRYSRLVPDNLPVEGIKEFHNMSSPIFLPPFLFPFPTLITKMDPSTRTVVFNLNSEFCNFIGQTGDTRLLEVYRLIFCHPDFVFTNSQIHKHKLSQEEASSLGISKGVYLEFRFNFKNPKITKFMVEDQTFNNLIQTAILNPWDDLKPLVLADYLTENGFSIWADYVRQAVELSRIFPTNPSVHLEHVLDVPSFSDWTCLLAQNWRHHGSRLGIPNRTMPYPMIINCNLGNDPYTLYLIHLTPRLPVRLVLRKFNVATQSATSSSSPYSSWFLDFISKELVDMGLPSNFPLSHRSYLDISIRPWTQILSYIQRKYSFREETSSLLYPFPFEHPFRDNMLDFLNPKGILPSEFSLKELSSISEYILDCNEPARPVYRCAYQHHLQSNS